MTRISPAWRWPHLDKIAIVSDLFAPFSRVEGATFAWPTTGIVFPIHDIVPQVTFAQFQDIDLEIREEQLHWVTATLEHLMQVPVLGLDELPEIVDMPPVGVVSPIALSCRTEYSITCCPSTSRSCAARIEGTPPQEG